MYCAHLIVSLQSVVNIIYGDMKGKRIIGWVLLLLVSLTVLAQQKTRSGLYPQRFQETIDGKNTSLFTLVNDNGAEACITNYGARLVSLMMPNWNGRMEDVVLGYDNVMDYHTQGQNFGATVGRYVGRIIGPSFTLDGQRYDLQDNGKGVISHGGKPGFQDRVWDVLKVTSKTLVLRYVSPDGENGFPGELAVILTYTLGDNNALGVDFEVTTTKPTVLNLTNHSFFNISGDLNRNIEAQHLWLDSKEFAEYDDNKNVTGKLRKVKNTPMDFRKPHAVGDSIHSTYAQIQQAGGYDHNYCLNTFQNGKGDDTQVCASLYSPKSGIFMEMFTNEPGVQVYSGNFQGVGKDASIIRKHGLKYPQHVSVCLESQKYPDSPNKKDWVQPTLKPGEKYFSHAAYKFSVK